jgi:CubicO group peptidase (beta-lactamase class C family)
VIDQSVLEPFLAAVSERNLGVDAVHVRVRGEPPIDHRAGPDRPRNVHSIGKTVTALAIGLAYDDGTLDPAHAALSYLPELRTQAAPGADAITVRDLLTMTAGTDYRWPDSDTRSGVDHAAEFFASPVLDAPGQAFRYRGTNTYVLGRIIAAIYGADLLEFLGPRLFEPLQIELPEWERCPLGFPLGADGLRLRTCEVGSIAQLLLDDGAVEGRRIVSAEFIHRMTDDVVVPLEHRDDPESSLGYGWQIWQCTRPHTWRMDGLYGQFGILLRDLDACIALAGHYDGSTGDILRAVWTELVPAIAAC